MQTSHRFLKRRVEDRFSIQAESYQQAAQIQKQIALQLARSLEPWRLTLPPGPVFEFGAGTGFLTRELVPLLPSRDFHITDLSSGMVDYSKKVWADHPSVRVELLDAEIFEPGGQKYALITGNFVAQWFRDPAWSLGRLAEALLPGGLLLTSFPGVDSLKEWKKICMDLGLDWTGNPFPDTEEMVIKLSMGPCQVDYYEEQCQVTFPNALAFFRHLREIGADTSLQDKQLSGRQFRQLLREWDRLSGPSGISVTWHLVFLALKRDS